MNLSSINWGDDSAEKDRNLLSYFVSNDAINRLSRMQKNLIVGRKGAGKSAARRKLSEIFGGDKSSIVLNLSPNFQAIKSILNDESIFDGFGEEVLFTHTWLRQIYLDSICAIGHEERGGISSASYEFARDVAKQQNRTSKDFVENIADVLKKVKARVGSLGDFGIDVEKELRSIADVDSLEHHFLEISKKFSFFVLVDDLDLGWNNSNPANNLILGLLNAANHIMSKSERAYVAVFLREDVYSIVIRQTQHSNKFRNIERLRWSKGALIELLSERINFNRKSQGLPEIGNAFHSVFPSMVGTTNIDNWLFERTLGRPRELIQLSRIYTESCQGDKPDTEILKDAESSYSDWKLDDLCAEFINQYPGLTGIFAFWKSKFYRRKYHLKFSEIDVMVKEIYAEVTLPYAWYKELVDAGNAVGLMSIFYEIGFIGDFVQGGDGGSKTFYSYMGNHQPRFEEIDIHPCFRKAVGTVDRIRK